MESDITHYKNMLGEMLGPYYFARYLDALRDLFGQKLTKETFDIIVSPFLNGDALVLHNLMILGILKKCDKDAKNSPIIEDEELQEIQVQQQQPVYETVETNTVESDPIIVPVILLETKPGVELNLPVPDLSKRFPVGFAESYQRVGANSKVPTNFVPNVTHMYDIQDRLDESKANKAYFPTSENGQPFTTYQSTYYGKCFLKAWSIGCQTIEIDAIDSAADFTYNHIKGLISAMVRQKKPFRRHLPKLNSTYSLIGDVYPNPYLNQGYHSYETFNRPEIISCGESMHVPDHISSVDERERLGVLRIAAKCPIPSPSPYERKALTIAELLAVLKDNPQLVPDAKLRVNLMTKMLEKLNCASRINSPMVEKRNVFNHTFDISEIEDEEGELMPSCSY